MKLYIGYEFIPDLVEYINLSGSKTCFVADTLEKMQERIDFFGEIDVDYNIYKVNLTTKQVASILDNTLTDCMPPDDNIKVIDMYIMSKGCKSPIPYNTYIKENKISP